MNLSAPAFPSSRELAALWRRLQAPDAATCWLGTVLLHRVEALVLVQGPPLLGTLELGTLRALFAHEPASLPELEDRLGIGVTLAQRVLAALAESGLVEPADADGWRLTAAGRAQATGAAQPLQRGRRRVFTFLQHPDSFLSFLDLHASGSPALELPFDWSFSPQTLADCIARAVEWKTAVSFPRDVWQLATLTDQEPTLAAVAPWERVVFDRAEHLTLVLVARGAKIDGYQVNPADWQLAATEPVLTMSGGAAITETFRDLLHEPDAEAWQAAWREWCAAQGIPLAEAAGIRFVRRGMVLQVTGHPLRPERLRALAGDANQVEHWLLAGTGPLRCAARLEFAAPQPSRPERGPRERR
jgi:hypothetical protein